jgi:hypothetical protein
MIKTINQLAAASPGTVICDMHDGLPLDLQPYCRSYVKFDTSPGAASLFLKFVALQIGAQFDDPADDVGRHVPHNKYLTVLDNDGELITAAYNYDSRFIGIMQFDIDEGEVSHGC